MPRKPRLQVAGLPVHIIQRGNNRQACFLADEDYLFFLEHLAKLAKRFHCSVHAYVLMTNHFHLLLDVELLREIRTSTHGGYAIGSERFREQIEHAHRQRATPRGPGRPASGSANSRH